MNTSRNLLVPRVIAASIVVLGVVVASLVLVANTNRTLSMAGYVAVALAVAFVFVPLVRRLTISKTRAEEAHQKFEELFRQAPDGLVTIGEDESISSVNDALELMFGYTAEECVGQPVEMLMPERFRGRHHDLRVSWAANPTRRSMGTGTEFWGQRKNGTEFPVDCALNPCQVEGITAIATIRDDTQRKEAQDTVDASARRLERSNQQLDDFASVAAHDLQEPLRKVDTFVDLLIASLADDIGGRERDYLERLQLAARRMRRLIDGLLAYSKISSQGHDFEHVDLGAVAAEVVTDLASLIEETHAEVNIEDLPVIEANMIQMTQLLQNLIGNALKFHRPDVPPVVTVAGRIVEGHRIDGPQACRLTVEDNGIGIEEKYQDQIFSMFQRLHGRSEYTGAGIGLAVCQRIVDHHGGEITVISTVGEASTFIVSLPVNQELQADNSLASQVALAPARSN